VIEDRLKICCSVNSKCEVISERALSVDSDIKNKFLDGHKHSVHLWQCGVDFSPTHNVAKTTCLSIEKMKCDAEEPQYSLEQVFS